MKKYRVELKSTAPIQLETDSDVKIVDIGSGLLELQLNGKTKATINKGEFVSCLEE